MPDDETSPIFDYTETNNSQEVLEFKGFQIEIKQISYTKRLKVRRKL